MKSVNIWQIFIAYWKYLYLSEPNGNAWCYISWIKELFKIQNQPMDFNLTKYRKFSNFFHVPKKFLLVKFWCNIEKYSELHYFWFFWTLHCILFIHWLESLTASYIWLYSVLPFTCMASNVLHVCLVDSVF